MKTTRTRRLLTLIAILILSLSGIDRAQAQTDTIALSWTYNQSQLTSASTTYYWGFDDAGFTTVDSNYSKAIMPCTCTVVGIYGMAYVGGTSSSGQSVTVTLQKNGVDTALTFTQLWNTVNVPVASDTSHSASFTAGDTIRIKLVTPAWSTTPTGVRYKFALRATVSSMAQLTPPSSYNANTSRTSFTEPSLTGALDLTDITHQAGYSFTDPTFGSRITRITDASMNTSGSGRNFTPPDSGEVSSWNLDSTKFYVMDIEGGQFYPFSWNGTSAGRLGSPSQTTGGIVLTSILTGGAALPSWSGKGSQILWGTSAFKLRKLDFTNVNSSSTTVPYSEPLDYAAVYNTITGNTLTGSVCSLGVSGVDAANDFVATGINGGQDTWTWAVWWNSATSGYKILDTSTTPVRYWNSATSSWSNITGTTGGWHMHNVKIDRSGRYVLITVTTSDNTGTGNGKLVSWDTTNNTLSFTTPAYDGGHRSGGYGYMVNQYANGTDATQWLLRPASDLTTSPTLLVTPLLSDGTSSPQYTAMNPDFDEHSSWHTARNGTLYPVFSSTSRDVPVDGSHPWRPYDNEIVAIKTSTPGTIWRLAHHRSTRMSGGNRSAGYFDYSFGQVSPDGRYFLFGSNWGLTLHHSTGNDPNTGTSCAPNCYRIDTFVLELP